MEEIVDKKVRKPLSEENLQKLALAREKANQKRKEMSEQRKIEKEALIQQKLEEAKTKTDERMEKQAVKEAKKRMYTKQPEPKQEEPESEREEAEAEPVAIAVKNPEGQKWSLNIQVVIAMTLILKMQDCYL